LIETCQRSNKQAVSIFSVEDGGSTFFQNAVLSLPRNMSGARDACYSINKTSHFSIEAFPKLERRISWNKTSSNADFIDKGPTRGNVTME
jgi:hypothetical protein